MLYIIVLLILIPLITYTIVIGKQIYDFETKIIELAPKIIKIEEEKWGLIPNLVVVTKNIVKDENELIDSLNMMRFNYDVKADYETKIMKNNELDEMLIQIIKLNEKYPLLRSNELFFNIDSKILKISESSRLLKEEYNKVVMKRNHLIKTFPSNLVGILLDKKTTKTFLIH